MSVTNRQGVIKKYKERNYFSSLLSSCNCHPLLRLPNSPKLHDLEKIREFIRRFKIKKCAVLVDNTTRYIKIPDSLDVEIVGFYSHDLRSIGKTVKKNSIKSLLYDEELPDCDAWLVVSSRPTAAYALNEVLLRQERHNQYVIRLVQTHSTIYYSYVDFFAGDIKTLLHVNNYYDQLYNIPFPIDIRFTIRDLKGEVVRTAQRIIPPRGVIILDSEELNLTNFTGYIELEYELSWIRAKIQPFLHYWIDYISKHYIATTHQSGLKAVGSEFYFMRAYFPFKKEERLLISNLNNHHKEPVKPVAILQYAEGGKTKTIKRHMQEIPYKHVVFEDINELFADFQLDKIDARCFMVKTDKPVYRSNFYYSKDKHVGWFDVGHLTHRLYDMDEGHMRYVTKFDKEDGKICEANLFTADQLEALKKNSCIPWQVSFPILPKSTQIETFLKFAGETTYEIIPKFKVVAYDENGEKVLEKGDTLDIHRFINLNDYIASNNVKLDHGIFQIVMDETVTKVPYESIFLVGLREKTRGYMITTNPVALINGFSVNIPFYLNEKIPYSADYNHSPFQVYDIFCRGVSSEEFDTILVLWNLSSYLKYKRTIHIRISIVSPEGREYATTKEIPPFSLWTKSMKELLVEMQVGYIGEYFTTWIKGVDGQVLGFSLLYRKNDKAISTEHFFRGKF